MDSAEFLATLEMVEREMSLINLDYPMIGDFGFTEISIRTTRSYCIRLPKCGV